MRHHTRSLRITPPPFDPNRARPRAVIYVHLSEAALTAGSGVARVEDVGPVLLNRLHMLARPGSGISDPHSRYHHRVKTFGGWQVRQPEPGSWIWRSPHGRIYLVNPSLGNTDFAQAIWRAVKDAPQKLQSDPDMAGT